MHVIENLSALSYDDSPRHALQQFAQVARRKALSASRRYVPLDWIDRQGYHFGVLCCFFTTSIVLLINAVLTIVCLTKFRGTGILGTLQEGDCAKVKQTDLWLHLVINVLSTLLLGASNYCMQCLSSPTRFEVDKAHRNNIYLDIGAPSVRNLFYIAGRRRFSWLLLALSSIPLHLFYNSAVFSSSSTQEYTIFFVQPEFLTGSPWNFTKAIDADWVTEDEIHAEQYEHRLSNLQDTSSKLKRLENKECIDAYSPSLVPSYGDLLVVTMCSATAKADLIQKENQTQGMGPGYVFVGEETATTVIASLNGTQPLNNSLLAFNDMFRVGNGVGSFPYWMCPNTDGETCDTKKLAANASHWTWGIWPCPISHCMAQPATPHCEIQYNAMILLAVICCNFFKMLAMVFLLRSTASEPLVTIGDAIASFLEKPDFTTEGMCLTKRSRFTDLTWKRRILTYRTRQCRWFSAASPQRWLLTYLSWTAVIIVVVKYLVQFNYAPLNNFLLSGFGTVNAYNTMVIGGSLYHSATTMILLANIPQFLLSLLYFGFNGLFTNMLLAKEWNQYSVHRKYLRVTCPKGQQRSTYRLQLPYRYGIPLLVVAAILHWLVSQSIFLARIQPYWYDGQYQAKDAISTCGFSGLATFISLILSTVILLLGIAISFRKSKHGMPRIRSCSGGISAACHPPEKDRNAALKEVKWGVVSSEWSEREKTRVGHCSFSSFEVESPVDGQLYT